MTLTGEQQAAVETTKEKVVIIASAACGKTRIITERVKHLLSNGADPKKIVVITFTNAAADEMRTRIGDAGEDCFIGTIHSYANRLLTKKGVDTGRLIQEGKFDMFFELIEDNLHCIEEVDHLILDEAQDSDESQFVFILDRIKPKNFFIVGDPRQAIYGFRGARPDILVDISKRSDVYTYRVKRNYRNGGEILAFAKEKLGTGGPWDDSIAMSDDCGKVYRMADTPRLVCKLIRDTKDSEYRDWFILCRTNAAVDNYVLELQAAQIPCDTFKMAGKSAQELHDIIENNSVKVLTIHTSKGLEAKNVIIIGSRHKPYDDEECRLNYVAATRAKKRLFWTYPEPKYNRKRKKEDDGVRNWER
jgi:DNA helicase-2/ATP-dependent DNA helicase PcrA